MDDFDETIHDSERTPLLEQRRLKKTKTPLDKLQIAIILLGTVCEPICSQSIYPFINEVSLNSIFMIIASLKDAINSD